MTASERDDVREVLELLNVPTESPFGIQETLLGLGGAAGVVLSVPAIGAGETSGLLIGFVALLAGATMLAFAGMSFGHWRQLRELAVHALRGGLSVHEAARTIGGVPSLHSLRFEGWHHQAQRRIEQSRVALVREAVRRGAAGDDEGASADRWTQQARQADRFLDALGDLRDVTRPGPLRNRIDDVIKQARTVRADVHRLTVVGAAAGDNAAAQDAATRVHELLDSLQVALDSTTGSVVAAEHSDGIDTAATLQDAATALLQAHQEVAEEQAGAAAAERRSLPPDRRMPPHDADPAPQQGSSRPQPG